MAYRATVIQVMIASPSDVEDERNIIRTVIGEWNDQHSENQKIVLLPVGWVSQAVPQMGDRAQAFINRDVLARCDILVAVFWTRLGNPTVDSPSGTVEEIQRHTDAGKPAMLYFSDKEINPSKINNEQYDALKGFREKCKRNGLIESFESIEELHNKFSRQLTKLICEIDIIVSDEYISDTQISLSNEAYKLLEASVKDRGGEFLNSNVMGGRQIHANNELLNNPSDARDQANWDSAIEELEALDFIQDQGYEREVFGVTKAGYDFYDSLNDKN